MEKVLVKCTVESVILKRMILISSAILIALSLIFLLLNPYVSIVLGLIFIIVLCIIRNVDNFCLTDEGVYVCKGNGSAIYGYKYFEIDRIDMVRAGDYIGIVISNPKLEGSHFLVIRDKTKITVPEYVSSFHLFLNMINDRVNDKLSNEVKEYIKSATK